MKSVHQLTIQEQYDALCKFLDTTEDFTKERNLRDQGESYYDQIVKSLRRVGNKDIIAKCEEYEELMIASDEDSSSEDDLSSDFESDDSMDDE